MSARRSVGQVSEPSEVGYEVVLLRHGETVGYGGDLGLTELGARQARERGTALAAELKQGTAVRMPHGQTARAAATAAALRAALLEALGEAQGVEVGQPYAEPWFDNIRFSLHGEAVDTSAAVVESGGVDGDPPDWVREVDRFNVGDHAVLTAGGPIGYWMHNPTLYFEPPHLAAHRVWRGVVEVGADRPDGLVVLAATHSGPMRAFVATCLGADPGEPHNLEDVRVRVRQDGSATVTFREHVVETAVPGQLPPWIDSEWLESFGR